MRINLVVAVGKNGVIGRDGELPWRIPADLKHFRDVTTGHPIIMGRKTWESLGAALPGRTNIVITRNPDYRAQRASVVCSLDDALGMASGAEGGEEVMVIGGAEIYRLALAGADRIYLTEIDDATEGDTLFPVFDRRLWQETERKDFKAVLETPAFSFVTLDKHTGEQKG